ncbi:THO complex subunit 7 homolog [Convolutriloba macropyga]|uniref:THO complex subunit 7 homolog n=1 Tax=Convolutriloba macropyga TaxID=536237 RepID=UPI003F51B04F
MSSMEEDMIYRRLLLEGDTGGDDKRMTQLLRSILKLSDLSDNGGDGSDSPSEAAYKIITTLNQAETAVRRCTSICDMNANEVQFYEQELSKIEKSIEESKASVESFKEALENAKVVRKHKQAFDSLAQTILKEPARDLSVKRLEAIKGEMEQLHKTEGLLIDEQRDIDRHFKLFTFALAQLKSHLKVKEGKEAETGSADAKQSNDDDEIMEVTPSK